MKTTSTRYAVKLPDPLGSRTIWAGSRTPKVQSFEKSNLYDKRCEAEMRASGYGGIVVPVHCEVAGA